MRRGFFLFPYAVYGKNNHRFIEKAVLLWYNKEDACALTARGKEDPSHEIRFFPSG